MKQFIAACLLFAILSCTKQPELKPTQPTQHTIEGTYFCYDSSFFSTIHSTDSPIIYWVSVNNRQRNIKVIHYDDTIYRVGGSLRFFTLPFGLSRSYWREGGYYFHDSLYIDGKIFFQKSYGLSEGGPSYQTITGKKVE